MWEAKTTRCVGLLPDLRSVVGQLWAVGWKAWTGRGPRVLTSTARRSWQRHRDRSASAHRYCSANPGISFTFRHQGKWYALTELNHNLLHPYIRGGNLPVPATPHRPCTNGNTAKTRRCHLRPNQTNRPSVDENWLCIIQRMPLDSLDWVPSGYGTRGE